MTKIYLLLFCFTILQSCSNNCEDRANMYRKAEFEMKIEKMSNNGTRHYTIEGKNRSGKNIKWEDPSNWILSIHRNIEIGDSIGKQMGKAFLTVKKPNDSTSRILYLECEGKKYK